MQALPPVHWCKDEGNLVASPCAVVHRGGDPMPPHCAVAQGLGSVPPPCANVHRGGEHSPFALCCGA